MWEPQSGNQAGAIAADWVDEVFYGGERGGGKSDFQLGFQEDGALRYKEYWRGIMFRKTYTELEELQSRAIEIYPDSGATYKAQSSADYPFSNCWYWPNGATVKMRYIEHERDYGRYHGHQYTGISFDEVTEYPTPNGLLKMLSTLRSAHGVPCTVRLTGNPGGVGHGWVKLRYIDAAKPMTPFTDAETGFTRMFVPSKMSDNQILMESDPKYQSRILAATAGNEVLRKAWLEGDWNIVAGAFFSGWSKDNIIKPFEIPTDWLRFLSGDWGSAKPFSFGWWAVASDDTFIHGKWIPKGAMVRYREWYGCEKDNNGQSVPDVGLKLHASTVGKGLKERTKEKLDYAVIDPAAFAEDGGPSIVERICSPGINFAPADNKRVARAGAMGGWDQMAERISGEDHGDPMRNRPMIYCFDTCTDSTRTIPVLQHDATRPEDLDTKMEDHAADEWRYACMSRPWIKASNPKPVSDIGSRYKFNRQQEDTWKTV